MYKIQQIINIFLSEFLRFFSSIRFQPVYHPTTIFPHISVTFWKSQMECFIRSDIVFIPLLITWCLSWGISTDNLSLHWPGVFFCAQKSKWQLTRKQMNYINSYICQPYPIVYIFFLLLNLIFFFVFSLKITGWHIMPISVWWCILNFIHYAYNSQLWIHRKVNRHKHVEQGLYKSVLLVCISPVAITYSYISRFLSKQQIRNDAYTQLSTVPQSNL